MCKNKWKKILLCKTSHQAGWCAGQTYARIHKEFFCILEGHIRHLLTTMVRALPRWSSCKEPVQRWPRCKEPWVWPVECRLASAGVLGHSCSGSWNWLWKSNSGSGFKPRKQPVNISWGYHFYLQTKVDKLLLKVVRNFRDRVRI